jgi:hypothetical protein
MKKHEINFKLLVLSLVIMLSTSCSQDFLDRPSEDGFNTTNFYSSDLQVSSTTLPFYGRSWWNFTTKWMSLIGDLGSGNLVGGADGQDLAEFKLTSTSDAISKPWLTFYGVIAQANNIINNLEEISGPDVSSEAIQTAVAEAHFMRGLAYFYLVRIYGEVPIIEDNLEYVTSPLLDNNLVEDVYTLIKRDFIFASENLPAKMRGANYGDNIKISKGTAKSFLAKSCLQNKDYADAVKYSTEVINSGEFKLLDNYGDLFLFENNNNEESIFSFQFEAKGYFFSNYNAIQYGIAELTEATYGATYVPSYDIQDAFEANDKRRQECFMVVGDFYPNLKSDLGVGFTLLEDTNGGITTTNAFVKKYVLGKPTAETGIQDGNGTSACTYVMRYADLLLIQAEAIMGANTETTDATALKAYKDVRDRAGLETTVTKITRLDLLNERRVELAFEGEFWFDILRLPTADAISYIAAQNRGKYDEDLFITPKVGDLTFPKPASEVTANPKLLEPGVPYNFN